MALLLARCGLDVALVERETSFERVFRGEAQAEKFLEESLPLVGARTD